MNASYFRAVNVYNGKQKIVAIRGQLTEQKFRRYKNAVANGPQTVECYVQFEGDIERWTPVDIQGGIVRKTGDSIRV